MSRNIHDSFGPQFSGSVWQPMPVNFGNTSKPKSGSTSSAPQDGLTVAGSFGNVPFDINIPHTKVVSTLGNTWNSITDFFSRPDYNETDFDEDSETFRVWDSSWDTVDHSIDVGSNPTPEEVEKWQDIGASLTKEQWNDLIGSEGTVTKESVQEKYPDVVENYVPGASSQVSGKLFSRDVSGSKLDLNNIEFTDKDGSVSNKNIGNLIPGLDSGIVAGYSFVDNKIDIPNQNKDALSSIQSTLGTDISKYEVNEALNTKEPFIQNDVFLRLDVVTSKEGTSDQPERLKLYQITGINESKNKGGDKSFSNPFGKDNYSAVTGKQTTSMVPRSSEYWKAYHANPLGQFFSEENIQQIASDTSFNSFNPEVRGKLYDPEFHSKDSEGNVLGIKDKYNIGVGEFVEVSGSSSGQADHSGKFTSYYANVGSVSDLLLYGGNAYYNDVLNETINNFKDYYTEKSTRSNVDFDTGWLEIGRGKHTENMVLQGAALGVTTFNNSQIDSYLTEATVQKDLQDLIESNGNFTNEQSAALTNKIWEGGVDDLGKIINPEYFTDFVSEVTTTEDPFTSDKVKEIMGEDLNPNSEGSVWNTDEDGNVLFDIGDPKEIAEEIAATESDTDEIIPPDITVNEDTLNDGTLDDVIDSGDVSYTDPDIDTTPPDNTITSDSGPIVDPNDTYVDPDLIPTDTGPISTGGTPLVGDDYEGPQISDVQSELIEQQINETINEPSDLTSIDESIIDGAETEELGLGYSNGPTDNTETTAQDLEVIEEGQGELNVDPRDTTAENVDPQELDVPPNFTEEEIKTINTEAFETFTKELLPLSEGQDARDFDTASAEWEEMINLLNKQFGDVFTKENLLGSEQEDHWFDNIINTIFSEENAATTIGLLEKIVDEFNITEGFEEQLSDLEASINLDPGLLETQLDEYLRLNEVLGREPKYTIDEDGRISSGLDTDETKAGTIDGKTYAEADAAAEASANEPEFIPELQKGVLDIRSPEDTGSRDIGETFNREGERISNIRKEQLNQMYEGAGISKSDPLFYENQKYQYDPFDTNKDSIVDQLEIMDKVHSGELTSQDNMPDIGKYDPLTDATPIDVDPEKGLPKLNRKTLSSGQSYNVTAETSDPIRTQERKLPQNNPIPEIMEPQSQSPTGAKPAWQQLGYGSQEQYGSTRERPWNKMSQTHLDQLKKDGIDTSYTESLREQDAKAKYAGTPAKNAASPQERIKAQAERRRAQQARAKSAFTPRVGSYQ